VVIGQSDDHDGPDDDLTVDDDRLLLDGVHTQDGSLREVDAVCAIVHRDLQRQSAGSRAGEA
jgi:hypothetical protein